MSKKYTADELNTLGTKELTSIILSQQEQMQNLNDSLENSSNRSGSPTTIVSDAALRSLMSLMVS